MSKTVSRAVAVGAERGPRSDRSGPIHRELLPALFVLIGAAAVYAAYGFDLALGRDGSVFFYGGQRMADGVPPYVSIFDVKTPLGPMLIGLGVMLARLLGLDEIAVVRVCFLAISCFTALAVYLLGWRLFDSRRAGLFGAATFLAFSGFGGQAASGPHVKTPMVLFECLSLLATAQRRWLLAGLCGSFAFLLWQPMAIFPFVTLLLAAACPRETRARAISRTLAGITLPLALTASYFLYHGAFDDLLDGSIFFHLRHRDRPEDTVVSNVRSIGRAVLQSYRATVPPILVGLATMLSLYVWRWRLHRSWRDTFTRDPLAPVLLTFPAPVAWSLLDFQSYTDFFVFLPYLAIAFGYALHRAVDAMERAKAPSMPATLSTTLAAVLCVALIGAACVQPQPRRGTDVNPDFNLDSQKAIAAEIRERFGPNAKFVSIGAPELLVILRATNPNRYPFIINGIDRHIDANAGGGFDGWLRELQAYDPDVIAVGNTRGAHVHKLLGWVQSSYREEIRGPWKLYVRE